MSSESDMSVQDTDELDTTEEEPSVPQSGARKRKKVTILDSQSSGRKRRRVGRALDDDDSDKPSPTRRPIASIPNHLAPTFPPLRMPRTLSRARLNPTFLFSPSSSKTQSTSSSTQNKTRPEARPSASTSCSQPQRKRSNQYQGSSHSASDSHLPTYNSSQLTPSPSRTCRNASPGPSSRSQPTPSTSKYPKPKLIHKSASATTPVSQTTVGRRQKEQPPASYCSSSSDWEPPEPTIGGITSPEKQRARWRGREKPENKKKQKKRHLSPLVSPDNFINLCSDEEDYFPPSISSPSTSNRTIYPKPRKPKPKPKPQSKLNSTPTTLIPVIEISSSEDEDEAGRARKRQRGNLTLTLAATKVREEGGVLMFNDDGDDEGDGVSVDGRDTRQNEEGMADGGGGGSSVTEWEWGGAGMGPLVGEEVDAGFIEDMVQGELPEPPPLVVITKAHPPPPPSEILEKTATSSPSPDSLVSYAHSDQDKTWEDSVGVDTGDDCSLRPPLEHVGEKANTAPATTATSSDPADSLPTDDKGIPPSYSPGPSLAPNLNVRDVSMPSVEHSHPQDDSQMRSLSPPTCDVKDILTTATATIVAIPTIPFVAPNATVPPHSLLAISDPNHDTLSATDSSSSRTDTFMDLYSELFPTNANLSPNSINETQPLRTTNPTTCTKPGQSLPGVKAHGTQTPVPKTRVPVYGRPRYRSPEHGVSDDEDEDEDEDSGPARHDPFRGALSMRGFGLNFGGPASQDAFLPHIQASLQSSTPTPRRAQWACPLPPLLIIPNYTGPLRDYGDRYFRRAGVDLDVELSALKAVENERMVMDGEAEMTDTEVGAEVGDVCGDGEPAKGRNVQVEDTGKDEHDGGEEGVVEAWRSSLVLSELLTVSTDPGAGGGDGPNAEDGTEAAAQPSSVDVADRGEGDRGDSPISIRMEMLGGGQEIHRDVDVQHPSAVESPAEDSKAKSDPSSPSHRRYIDSDEEATQFPSPTASGADSRFFSSLTPAATVHSDSTLLGSPPALKNEVGEGEQRRRPTYTLGVLLEDLPSDSDEDGELELEYPDEDFVARSLTKVVCEGVIGYDPVY